MLSIQKYIKIIFLFFLYKKTFLKSNQSES